MHGFGPARCRFRYRKQDHGEHHPVALTYE
jgi:hypothetical protein